jgi:ATP-dependent Clp protease, protease subunit
MKGIRIINRAEKASAEILIYEDIGEGFFTSGVTAQGFLKELRALGDVKQLDIRINSNGGSVFDGVAIYNALRQHPASKTVHVDGIAASIASIIAMAGDDIRMGEGAWMMIHDPSGLAIGTSEQMRDTADLLDGIKSQLVDIYTSRTGLEPDAVQAMMAAETWMTAEDAINQGFATSYGAPLAVAAHADSNRFRNIPAVLNHSNSGPTDVPNTPAAPAAAVPTTPIERTKTMNIMAELKARASDHQIAAASIREKANAENRDLTQAERDILNRHLDSFDQVQADIELQARLESAEDFLNQSAGRKIQPDGMRNTVVRTTAEKGKNGFSNLGDFAKSVRSVVTSGEIDPRLISNTATTYGQEGVGADGGFAVPPEYKAEIMSAGHGRRIVARPLRCHPDLLQQRHRHHRRNDRMADQRRGPHLLGQRGRHLQPEQAQPQGSLGAPAQAVFLRARHRRAAGRRTRPVAHAGDQGRREDGLRHH